MIPFRMLKLAFLALLFAMVAGGLRAEEQTEDDSPYTNVEVLARAMQLIRQDYVDEHKTTYRDLTYNALRGMLQELDPHSQFMDAGDFKDMQDDTKSEFGGLGVVVTMEGGQLTIVSAMEDTPGFQAGFEPGDTILEINGQSTEKLTLPQAIEKLRGEVGDKITLTVQNLRTKEIKDHELTRVIIKVSSVKDARILPGPEKIGYVRITQFSEPTVNELTRALEKLEKQGMQALVIDLRYNPGGLLNSAVDVCGLFLPPNTKVASTEGRAPGREYRTVSRALAQRKYPVAVLVNYASASGSEIVAGALKDLNRAIIIGETTFGKGSVQSVIALPDGSAMRLTTNKYFTPSKQVIHEHGVSPNIRSVLSRDQELELLRIRREQERTGLRQIFPEKDPQLSRALDVLRGTLIFSERKKQATAPKVKES